MAVTAFTTAARAARAQAAANKLEEEREDPLSPSQHHHHSQSPEPPLVNGAKCTTQVEVHVDNDQPSVIHVHPMESVKRDSRRDSEREKDLERDRDMAFVKVTPAARLKVIKQMEHVKHEASADRECTWYSILGNLFEYVLVIHANTMYQYAYSSMVVIAQVITFSHAYIHSYK